MGKGSGICDRPQLDIASSNTSGSSRSKKSSQQKTRKARTAQQTRVEPWWLNEAILKYKEGCSLREVAQEYQVGKETVRGWFIRRKVKRRIPSKGRPITPAIQVKETPPVVTETTKESMLQMLREYSGNPNIAKADLEDLLALSSKDFYFEGQGHHSILSSQKFMESFAKGLTKRHYHNGGLVLKFDFENLLRDTYQTCFNEVSMPEAQNHPGADLYRLDRGIWRGTSCKTEHTKEMYEGNAKDRWKHYGAIAHLCSTGGDVETGTDAVRAMRIFKEHMNDYDEILYLRAYHTQFKDNPDKKAIRYNLFEIPKEIFDPLFRKSSRYFEQNLSSRNSSTHHILAQNSRKKLYTLGFNRGKMGIRDLDLSLCTLHSSFWVDPPQARNS